MFKIESYVTPILLSYVDKYVRDFKPANAQVSLWEGGVALHNLVLKADVLQKEINLPFTLVSGRIHELLIQVPWTKIMSEPIVVTIDTIECILGHPSDSQDDNPAPETSNRKQQMVEAPPGYMQALVRRIVSNISLKIHHLIVKFVHDDIVLSLNIKHLTVDSAGSNWNPAFADIDQNQPVIRKLVRLDDLTLCLDRTDSDGKIRYFQEPLLPRCQLDLRVLTKLVSANTRRASSVSVELRSSKLAWGVTNDQVVLLLRLLREKSNATTKPPNVAAKATASQSTLHPSPSDSAEPARTESWSEWAWSWVPDMDQQMAQEAAPPTIPTPIHFSAYLDEISLVYKVMEEGGSRKRARGILELCMQYAGIKSDVCAPTTLRVAVDVYRFVVKSNGKCVCGHLDANGLNDEPTIYLSKISNDDDEEFTWPENDFDFGTVEKAEVADEFLVETLDQQNETSKVTFTSKIEMPHENAADHPNPQLQPDEGEMKVVHKSAVRIDFTHERSPPTPYTNPYDNPPKKFEYSDWEEVCNLKIHVAPMKVQVCMGLIHRVAAIRSVLAEGPPAPVAELPIRILTVEECDSLLDNLPQRRINIDVAELIIHVFPWDHSLTERPSKQPLLLEVELPKINGTITSPLYPHRVCTAACQMPDDSGPIWQGARLHLSIAAHFIQANICNVDGTQKKPCARVHLRFVVHVLLNKQFFTRRQSITFSYSFKLRELNLSGSAARLQAASQVISSLSNQKFSLPLRYTSLARDALNDEELVALDMTLEDLSMRGFLTNNTNTHIATLHSARATFLHAREGEELKQAWLFSAPDVPSSSPYLRMAVQWCTEPFPSSLDYFGAWTEPTAVCVDPLFIAWLSYRSYFIQNYETLNTNFPKSMSSGSSSYLLRRDSGRRNTPPSSSGRGASAEQVHVRPRSAESSSEPSDKRENKPPPQPVKCTNWWSTENLLPLHERLKHLLISSELGLVLVYVTTTSASAVDCATVRLAMEQHTANNRVLVLSVGRWSLHSSTMTKHLWQDIKHDGPTFVAAKSMAEDAFPWKMRLADVSCYIMENSTLAAAASREKSTKGLLKVTHSVNTRTVLELVTTTVTLSVVTKSIQYKTLVKKPEHKKYKKPTQEEAKMKYFTSGPDFKPTTLKEFVRGPASRKQPAGQGQQKEADNLNPVHKTTTGPVVSLGFHLHADTPPIIVRLDQDQVHTVGAALHCFTHILTLLRRAPLVITKQTLSTTTLGEKKSFTRSITEIDEMRTPTESTNDNNDLISIFETTPSEHKVHTFVWFQWVMSRATLVVSTYQVKLVFEMDDIISTVDLQEHYNQLRVKIASASVKHYERADNEEQWSPGVFKGRVLEAREPENAQDDNHFFSITITQAQQVSNIGDLKISNLPASWKDELHPKMFDPKYNPDTIWEIYATLAPLEIVLLPVIIEHILYVASAMAPKSYCPLEAEVVKKPVFHWPFCYLNAGGIRVLISCRELSKDSDDTFVFSIQKITVNPYPENPISRKPINACAENIFNVGGVFEGRQYEVLIRHASIRTTQFMQLVYQEMNETGVMGAENPAHMWTQPIVAPVLTYVLHPVDIGLVIAPAMFIGRTLVAGPGVELNLMTDCSIELGTQQMAVIRRTAADLTDAVRRRESLSNEDFPKSGMCSYATFLEPKIIPEYFVLGNPSDITLTEEPLRAERLKNFDGDSGLDTVASFSTMKKSASVSFVEQVPDPSDYLEVFVTMGVIDVALYTMDQKNIAAPEQAANTAPVTPLSNKETSSSSQNVIHEPGGSNMDLLHTRRLSENKISLIHVILYQPNIYYNKKKWQKNIQVSLFNMWLGLDASKIEDSAALFTTARGVNDPVTDIPPALATMRYTSSGGGGYVANSGSTHGSLTLDIERPILFQVSCDHLTRLQMAYKLIKNNMSPKQKPTLETALPFSPLAYKIRRTMIKHNVETLTVQTSQIGVSGSGGTAGWDSASLQVGWSARPERLVGRAFVSSLMVAFETPNEPRRQILQPLQLGAQIECSWDAWRRIEGGLSERDPVIRLGLEFDRVVVDLRPDDLDVFKSIQQAIKTLKANSGESTNIGPVNPPSPECLTPRIHIHPDLSRTKLPSSLTLDSTEEFDPLDSDDHYYKDDLRSGAFKLVSGGQLPMAYQVVLNKNIVTWRYPHPRAITRIVAFPLIDQRHEIECVLEMHNRILRQWEPLTYFDIPYDVPKEINLGAAPPEAIFSTNWRFRVLAPMETKTKYVFDITKFLPKSEPMTSTQPTQDDGRFDTEVTAEQISGVLRVDSYFSPRLLPLLRVSMRLAKLEVHAYNSLPYLSSQATALEGYYVSKPLMRCHRMLSIKASDIAAYAQLGSPAGNMVLMESVISSDMFDCATGIMEQLVTRFRLQVGLALTGKGMESAKARVRASSIHAALHIPRIRTLQALFHDWKNAMGEDDMKGAESDRSLADTSENVLSKRELAAEAAIVLEGRVSLWIHNSCASALRVGQEGTDEQVPLGPGGRLAYRWRSPTAPKKLRFAFANPPSDWQWSSSIPFTVGESRVILEENDTVTGNSSNSGVFVHVSVKQVGATRQMRLSGRLVLANMLRLSVLYKVRARQPNGSSWQSIFSGELGPETVGRSVICHSNCDMALKVRYMNHNTGWSGDIPLKECPKENVPWLVKVPSEGDMPYVSVWCRVVRARFDGRLLAAIWPLYVLHSHIALDTDILLATDMGLSGSEVKNGDLKPAPLIQTAPGRGCSTHLLAPGTTSAKHSLTFQYRNIECPVTREAVPLHYGVTDTSVFDKSAPVYQIDEVLDEIIQWLERSGKGAKSTWPYSQVASHWPGSWQAALMQPRCDVAVRYRAIRAGGGCSLEIQLCPVSLLCNASPISLTLRAHDAAPLCKLEPGNAISPPTAILKKPFFMSVEIGRETFVSGQLEVATTNPGRYGTPPPGQVAIDHAANFAIQCSQKAALLTLYYEIKEDINVLGITSTFVLFNRLKVDILVSAIAVSTDIEKDVVLRPKSYKVVPPTKDNNHQGVPLSRFWLYNRWRGGDACELVTFLCVALNKDVSQTYVASPVGLGTPPFRKALALRHSDDFSVPVVVTQHKHEGRWIVTVGKDPCPQFVVHNLTRQPILIAEPKAVVMQDKPEAAHVTACEECPGASWWCTLGAGSSTHYSTPAHCTRLTLLNEASASEPVLTFARAIEGIEPDWCTPVTVEDGEQLVQLDRRCTIKMRVKTHPHSTYIELLDVGQTDIAASDIRKRLLGSFIADDVTMPDRTRKLSVPNLERVGGNNRLPVRNIHLDKALEELPEKRERRRRELELAQVEGKDVSQSEQVDSDEQGYSGAIENEDHLPPQDSPDDSQPRETDSMDTNPIPSSPSRSILKSQQQIKFAKSTKSDEEQSLESENEIPEEYKDKPKDDSTVATLLVQEQFVPVSVNPTLAAAADVSKGNNIKPMSLEKSEGSEHGSAQYLTESPLLECHKRFSSENTSAVFRPSAESGDLSECEAMADVAEERIRCVLESIVVELAAWGDIKPMLCVHTDRAALLVSQGHKRMSTTLSVADIQIDNLQYDTGQYDFAVVATTRNEPLETDKWTALWNMFSEKDVFSTRRDNARFLLQVSHDKWTVIRYKYNEITELDVRLGPLALYIEDAYISALTELLKIARPSSPETLSPLGEARALQRPLRLRSLHIRPVDLTLTLHTAYRMYIALDHSPLHLNEFKVENLMTSRERLAHALTVHYLSAAILGAGWVVGGLELLGAPGALAARVGGATGGVRGVASAAAAALLRSLSALATSLARNLDLLAGDEEHARRAAAARRRPVDSLLAGLVAGVTNFAINMLGAVGGLAHHPLVGVAVGESESSAMALRRGILGALTKPLSATADLVAYAGHGLLRQTGWDPVPQPRMALEQREVSPAGWQRDCVRWAFRLAELSASAGFEALIDDAPRLLLFTHKFLVIGCPESDKIVEMIDFKFCTLGPYQGPILELRVAYKRNSKAVETRVTDDDELQINAAAMARVARYTGATPSTSALDGSARVLYILPRPGLSHSLYAALVTATHHNSGSYFSFL